MTLLLALPIGMLAQGTTWQNATDVALGGSRSATMSEKSAVHWYKATVKENGALAITATPQADLGMRYITLYTVTGGETHERSYIWIGGAPTTLTINDCAPGTYYILLDHGSGEGSYSLGIQFAPTSANYTNDSEPDDTWQQAQQIGLNATVTGQMGYRYYDDTDKLDWFKVDVTENGALTLKATPQAGLGMRYITVCTVVGGEKQERTYTWIGGESATLTINDCAPGTYYIQLDHGSGEGGYTFSTQFAPASAIQPNDQEPNDAWQQAQLVKRGNTATGHLGYFYYEDTDKIDWFKIEVPRNGAISLTATPQEGLAMRYIDVFTVVGGETHERTYTWIGGAPTTLTINDCAPGTYYVKVDHGSGEGTYTLKYDFVQNTYASDAESNDTWQQAVSLEKDVTVAGHLGYLYWEDTDKIDWYKVTIPVSGTAQFKVKPLEGLAMRYIELFDANQSSKSYIWIGNAETELKIENLAAGTYYIKVDHGGGEGAYLLVYGSTLGTVTPQEPLPDEEVDPTPGGVVTDEFTVWYIKNVGGGTVTYKLSEKPQVRLLGEELTVTSSRGVATFKTFDVWKFTLNGSTTDPVGIEETVAPTQPAAEGTVSRQGGDVLEFSGFQPGQAVQVYTVGGRLVEQHRTDSAGYLELSLGSLAKGLYIVKSGSVTIKITKK